jgi:hypothetical protein
MFNVRSDLHNYFGELKLSTANWDEVLAFIENNENSFIRIDEDGSILGERYRVMLQPIKDENSKRTIEAATDYLTHHITDKLFSIEKNEETTIDCEIVE